MTTIDQIVLIFFKSPYDNWIKNINDITKIKTQYINIEPTGEHIQTKKIFYKKNIFSKHDKHIINFSNIISQNDKNIYVPLSINQQYFYDGSIIKHKFCGNNKEHIDIFNQKCLFAQFLINNELLNLIPKTYAVNCSNKILHYDNIQFPCIIKKNISEGGAHVVIVHNQKMLEICEKKYSDYIIQEFIINEDKTEYTCNFYIDKGEIITSVYYKDNSVRETLFHIQHGGLCNKKKMNDMNKYNNDFEKIFKKLNYTGFACIDFTLIDNKIKIFEINPRLGGTLVTDPIDFEIFLIEILNMFIDKKYI